MCESSTAWTAEKPAQVMDASSRKGIKILDRSELFRYCSQAHMELSKQVEICLNKEPWWLRASRTRPVDLSWLSFLVADQQFDSMQVDEPPNDSQSINSLSKGIRELSDFSIIERDTQEELASQLSSTSLHPRSVSFNDELSISQQFQDLEPFDYNSKASDRADEQPSRSQTPDNSMNYDSSLQFSDDDSDDDSSNHFFNGTFPKQVLQLDISPNLQIINMVLHWVTWKSQKFCSLADYKPHLHSASMHVASQWDSETISEEVEDQHSRSLPPVDGVDIDVSRRKVLALFISSRLTLFSQEIPSIDKIAVLKNIEVLLSTFDLTIPLEGLKSHQWNCITLAILYAISPRHPGLESVLNASNDILTSKFSVDLELVAELRRLFFHHG
jgi:hypothetical protein